MLGFRMRDKITSFTGIVTGEVNYLTGCNQALLAPAAAQDGALRGAEWFDVQRLERVDESHLVLDDGPARGSDKAAPKR